MSLLSDLFSGDNLLVAAATTDRGHITPGSSGPHVAKIQEALIRLDGAKIAVDSQYGPKTAAAVVAFKTKRNILNTAGRIDNIVGIKTMAALDAELLKGGATVAGTRSIKGAGAPVTIMPLRKVPLRLLTTFDDRFPSKDKNDLDFRNPPRPTLTFFESIAVGAFRANFDFVLEGLMSFELQQLAGSIGADMFQRFQRNTVDQAFERFPPGSPLSREVEALTAFKDAHNAIRSEFEDALKKQAATGLLDVNFLEANTQTTGRFGRPQLTNPRGIKTSIDLEIPGSAVTLQTVVGGAFQGGLVDLMEFAADANTGTYTAKLQYTLIDHFGVDNSDVLPPPPHGSPGQIAFWILQHERHPGHMPYITLVIIERSVTGSFV